MTLDDLQNAFDWANADALGGSAAYIHRRTGQIHLTGDGLPIDEDLPLPDDLDDDSLYIALPDKRELDLGRALVFEFVEDRLPDAHDLVSACFDARGAYAKFKQLLDRRGLLDDWHRFEQQRTQQALRQWAQDNALALQAPG